MNETHTNKIEKIQSYFRRNYVQNEMLKVRKTYEQVFNEIESSESEVCIVWPGETSDKHLSVLAYPEFVLKKNLKSEDRRLVKPLKEIKTKLKQEQTIQTKTTSQNVDDDLDKIDLNSEQIKYLEFDNLKNMSKSELISLRESISLELLWIQQAIQSRIQYLKLKKSIQISRNIKSNEFN